MIVVDYDQFSLSIKVDPQLSQDLQVVSGGLPFYTEGVT